ncbi:hypothetical protein DOK78_002988 [Enterococcus sp. DIV2402]|uniref:Polysaccharide biosynthesis protein C-terminal domain-containing protein n=1 Tax=Candidatus Enterococcus lowellii TaxID=2230877 RepID=A0ABZ2SRD9_9ENTE|nr:oligosaccharide flippase family protein [Enterococcus sp. DIV2402]MBO0465349.1 oligosaccharide flippase family protein [Enterococcus sp. DIV2402]
MDKNKLADKTMIKKTIIYFIGNFSSKVLGTLIIPIYAIYLSASELGNYDFQQTIAQFVSPIIVLAIWEGILRYTIGSSKEKMENIVSTSIIFSMIMCVASFVILHIIYSNISAFNEYLHLYILMITLTPVVSVLQFSSRGIGKNTSFVFSGIFSTIINIGLLIVLVVFMKMGIVGLLISTIGTQIFTIIYIYIHAKIFELFSFSKFSLNSLKILLSYSIPLIFNLVFAWFLNGFSRFFVNYTFGATENGIFAFSLKFAAILATIGQVISMVVIEDAILSKDDKHFINRFEKNIGIIFSTMLNLSILLIPLITISYQFITNNDFKSSLIYIPFVMLGTIFINMSTNVGSIFNVFSKTTSIFITSLLAAFSNIIGVVILSHFFGVLGVAFSYLISGFVLLLCRYILGSKIIYYKINWRDISIQIIIYTFVSFISLLNILIINIVLEIVLLLFYVYLYRKGLAKYINKFKERLIK